MASAWIGMARIDWELGLRKGSAFKAFKSVSKLWREGIDFRVLHHERDREELLALKQSGEVHASSVNAVVLAPERAQELRARLQPGSGE